VVTSRARDMGGLQDGLLQKHLVRIAAIGFACCRANVQHLCRTA
jgi:hypothetical protein